MDDEAVVVVPVELRSVAVRAVALVPLLVLAKRVVDARAIPCRAQGLQRRFDHRRKQQPVVEPRHDRTGGLQRRDQLPLRRRVEAVAQRARRAEESLREERGIDQRLPIAGEVQEIRRGGIDGAARSRGRASCAYRCAAVPPGVRVGRQLEPRRDAGDQPAERLEMRDRSPVGAWRLFHRHRALERAVGQVGEHRIGEPAQRARSRCRVRVSGRLRRLTRSRAAPRGTDARGLEKVATIQVSLADRRADPRSSARRDDRGDDRRVPLALIGQIGAAHPHDRRPADPSSSGSAGADCRTSSCA